MKAINRFLFVLMLAVILIGCSSSGRSPDNTSPVITLTGDNLQILAFGEAYVELGATASDNRSGDLTTSIVIDATSVDTSTPGDYTVTYNVTDAAGNAATVTRTVTVRPPVPEQVAVTVEGDIKQLIFKWDEVQYTEHYRLMENPDGHSGFTQVSENVPAGTLTTTKEIAVHLFDWVNAQYIVEACNVTGCSTSDVITVTDVMLDTIGYFKASNTDPGDGFGGVIALSANGNTMAVSAGDDSCATGMNGDQDDDSCVNAGAVYLFRFDGTAWAQQAYIKASNTEVGDFIGTAVALSADGNTLAAGAAGEDSCATGVNGDPTDNTCTGSGAVYVFRFENDQWTEQAYIKASNTDAGDHFGAVALSADGRILAVGAGGEDSFSIGINGNQQDNSTEDSGAVYLFKFEDGAWYQQAYIKSSNPDIADKFGSVAISSDGNTLAVGAIGEDSCSTGVNGDPTDNSCDNSGSVSVFRYVEGGWVQQAYVKASDTKAALYRGDWFGLRVALSDDGNTLAVGQLSDGIAFGPWGKAYLFRFEEGDWDEQDRFSEWRFASSIALSGDGNTLALGVLIDHPYVGVFAREPIPCDCNEFYFNGAVILYRYDGVGWIRSTFIAPSHIVINPEEPKIGYGFGSSMAISTDASTLAVGATNEPSSAIGIDSDPTDELAPGSGAVFVY